MINLQHKIVSNYPLSEGETMRIDIRYKEESEYAPIVIFSHGFKAYRKWGFIPYVCRKLASEGAIAINFDFALNGVDTDSEDLHYNNDKFTRNTILHEIDDLCQVIEYVTALPEVVARKNGEIHLIGHSRGGTISALVANKLNTSAEIINSLTLWNTAATLDRFTEHQKALWKKYGKLEFKDSHTQQTLSIDYKYYDELLRYFPGPRYHTTLQHLDIPVNIIHATEDLTVKYSEADLLNELIPNSHLFTIPKTGHDFGFIANESQPTKQLLAIIQLAIRLIFNKE